MTLLKKYGYSVRALVTSVYSELDWHPWLFGVRVTPGYYSEKGNLGAILDWLKEEVGLKEDKELKKHDFASKGLLGLLDKYNNSPQELIRAARGGGEGGGEEEGGGGKKPVGYWTQPENQRKFMLELGAKLGFQEGEREAWYSVKPQVTFSFSLSPAPSLDCPSPSPSLLLIVPLLLCF